MSSPRLLLPLAVLALSPASAAAAPLAPPLDPTYAGGAGIAFADFDHWVDDARRSALAPGEKVVVAGTGHWFAEQSSQIIVARFTEEGELDTGFSGDGMIADADGDTRDVGVDAAGTVYVVGESIAPEAGQRLWSLFAYGPDGDLRAVEQLDTDDAYEIVNGILVRPDGSALTVGGGYVEALDGHALIMAAYSPGTGFGAPVFADPIPDGEEAGVDALAQPGHDGAVVALDVAGGDAGWSAFARYTAAGALDTGFGAAGVVHATMRHDAFAAGPAGELVAAGGVTDEVRVERFTAAGAEDALWQLDLGGGTAAQVTGAAIQADGRILVSGHQGSATFVLRFTPDGAPDASFGGDGRVDVAPASLDALGATGVLASAKGPVITGGADSGTARRVFAARIAAPAPAATPEPAEPQPAPPPAPRPPAVEVKGVATQAPPAVTAEELVGFPSTRRCVSRRRFRIRLRERRGIRTLQATVAVNGRRVSVVRGKRLRAAVDLRRLPKGRFTVRIALKLGDGRTITGTRRYRTCTKRQRSKRRIRV